jgi:peptidyl-tRNA hydrolase, PTH2 family
MNVKQVIVMRKDLNMRKGKMVAQGAHAACAFLSQKVKELLERPSEVKLTQEELYWINNSFKKICVSVNSEQELLEIYDIAKQSDIRVHKIIDNGDTEFNGVPTLTCIALGPDQSELLDKITGHLQLL